MIQLPCYRDFTINNHSFLQTNKFKFMLPNKKPNKRDNPFFLIPLQFQRRPIIGKFSVWNLTISTIRGFLSAFDLIFLTKIFLFLFMINSLISFYILSLFSRLNQYEVIFFRFFLVLSLLFQPTSCNYIIFILFASSNLFSCPSIV